MMKSFLVLAIAASLIPSAAGWLKNYQWNRQRSHHHSVSHVTTSFTNTDCDCSPKDFTYGLFRRALDVNGDGEVTEREANDVLDQINEAPSLEDLNNMVELERRYAKTHSHISHKGCCVNTVHHSFIDNNNDGEVDKREAARILNLGEDHPGLSLFMHHADQKRDGTVDVKEFRDAVSDLDFCAVRITPFDGVMRSGIRKPRRSFSRQTSVKYKKNYPGTH